MYSQTHQSVYPISLDEIKARVAKKRNRNNGFCQLELIDRSSYEHIKEIINDFNEKLIRVDGDVPINLSINDGDRFLFISYDQSTLTHGLHKYPAKFFPELPRWLIKRYSKPKEWVLDPFSGSGTTNLEALLSNRNSVGIDVDPFSRFLSKVKVTPLDTQELNIYKDFLLKAILNYQPLKVLESDIPSFPYRDNWFNKEIILELTYLKKTIESLPCSPETKDFFKICFSSIVRGVSNADDNCTRTVIRKKLNKQVYPADVLRKFAEKILINVPKMIEFSKRCPKGLKPIFPEGMDARCIKYENNYFDLAVTSPPYANAVDYPRTHQLEIYWLDFSNGSLTPLKKKHVGNESVSSKDYNILHQIGLKDADTVISKIFEKDPRRAYIAFKYLDDMRSNLKEVHRVLKKEGRYIIVVGNNRIRGEIFESWKYILKLSDKIGFTVEKYFGSEIIKHFIKVPREERINTDWIIVLRK